MNRSNTWLLDFKSDVYSQSGEDGIISKILSLIPKKDRWCVEFGAWDGQYLSNTRKLIKQDGYSAILIEGNKAKCEELRKTYQKNKKVIGMNNFVGFDGEFTLDELLKNIEIPLDFDFLSIDIDGNDYHVWKAVKEYTPKLVCIEFNPTVPTEIEFIQDANLSVNQGSSLLSLVKLGKEKGYELVCVLCFNAFFVRKEYFYLFNIKRNDPATLRKDLSLITSMFSGFDGKIFLRGTCCLPWHKILIKESKIQILPRFLQKFPDNYSIIQKFLFRIIKKLL